MKKNIIPLYGNSENNPEAVVLGKGFDKQILMRELRKNSENFLSNINTSGFKSTIDVKNIEINNKITDEYAGLYKMPKSTIVISPELEELFKDVEFKWLQKLKNFPEKNK